jgi:hypothetical protein
VALHRGRLGELAAGPFDFAAELPAADGGVARPRDFLEAVLVGNFGLGIVALLCVVIVVGNGKLGLDYRKPQTATLSVGFLLSRASQRSSRVILSFLMLISNYYSYT